MPRSTARLQQVIESQIRIKETTPEAIKALHALGLKVAMITATKRATACIAQGNSASMRVGEVLPT